LRSQLAYALQESEQESLELQRQLAAARAEAGALGDALRAAREQGAEQERLVSELSAAVKQQQARLQAAQRDCEEAKRRLARCTPAEFERLHTELMAAKRAAADVPIAQEQAGRHRDMWRDAEDRLAKLQVGWLVLASLLRGCGDWVCKNGSACFSY
jgi:predicted  nucleic acid-binding Zn-ribbon protein